MKDIRKFLDLTNYYRRFIKDFAQVVRPMNMLMKKIRNSSGKRNNRRHSTS